MTTRFRSLGLSQLELLISLAVMAFIVIGLTNAISFQTKRIHNQQSYAQFVETHANRSLYVEYLEALPTDFAGSEASDFFSGSHDILEFQTSINDGDIWPGHLVSVRLLHEAGWIYLEVSALDWQLDPIERRLQIGKGQKLQVSYFGLKSEERERIWHSEWSDPARIPDLVKVHWESETGVAMPISVRPSLTNIQSSISLSSRVPPG